jgi:hypothetical protein
MSVKTPPLKDVIIFRLKINGVMPVISSRKYFEFIMICYRKIICGLPKQQFLSCARHDIRIAHGKGGGFQAGC